MTVILNNYIYFVKVVYLCTIFSRHMRIYLFFIEKCSYLVIYNLCLLIY